MLFDKISPEAAGISSRAVKRYIELLERRSIPMHSVLMMKGDKLFCECYFKPFHKDLNHRMYSQTKSFVAMAIGFLIDEGKLKLDDKIADFFPEKIDRELTENIKAQTVRNMLMMSTVGYGEPWFDNKDRDRVHLYFNAKRNLYRFPGFSSKVVVT